MQNFEVEKIPFIAHKNIEVDSLPATGGNISSEILPVATGGSISSEILPVFAPRRRWTAHARIWFQRGPCGNPAWRWPKILWDLVLAILLPVLTSYLRRSSRWKMTALCNCTCVIHGRSRVQKNVCQESQRRLIRSCATTRCSTVVFLVGNATKPRVKGSELLIRKYLF